jgi:hypothetical protein
MHGQLSGGTQSEEKPPPNHGTNVGRDQNRAPKPSRTYLSTHSSRCILNILCSIG